VNRVDYFGCHGSDPGESLEENGYDSASFFDTSLKNSDHVAGSREMGFRLLRETASCLGRYASDLVMMTLEEWMA
jgi:hypothetical protein